MKNFDLVPNKYHKRKRDGVGNREGRKQVRVTGEVEGVGGKSRQPVTREKVVSTEEPEKNKSKR